MFKEKFGEALGGLKEYILSDKKRALRIILILLIIVAAIIIKFTSSSKANTTIKESAKEKQILELCVDISGAVNKPGVYKVEKDTRLFEVIEMAGGLKAEADVDSINQAEFIEDGQKIIIPSISGNSSESDSGGGSSFGKININTASKEELTELTGIGDVIAQRIIDYRSKTRFNSIEDIKNVSGIGDAIFAKISDSITV